MTESAELSERELDVLRLVATGASNKQIAQDLSISQNTVKVHIRNIFSKTGVASRTEAAIFAVQYGYVDPSLVPMPEPTVPAEGQSSRLTWGSFALWQRAGLIAGGVVVGLVILVGILFLLRESLGFDPAPTGGELAAPVVERWQEKTPLESPRSGLALAAYNNQIYAISGEGTGGLTGNSARYNPTSNEWNNLAVKPTPVRDARGVVVGGRIFVPGGRVSDGTPIDVLEIFSPADNQWEKGASLPIGLSGYSAVAFEGQLYLFGGWDGQAYVDTVLRYDPDTDDWSFMTPLPTARGFAGAAESGGQIYVIGGTNNDEGLTVNEEYTPSLDVEGGEPWGQAAPIPEGRSAFGITSIAGIIHLVGGDVGQSEGGSPSYKFFPQTGTWEAFEAIGPTGWTDLGLVAVESSVHAVGGSTDQEPVDSHFEYIAIYTISIPIVQ